MVQETLIELLEARTVEDVWTLHTRRMDAYGFDRLLYGYSRVVDGTELGRPNDALILSTHTAEYLDHFVGAGLYHDAPMVRWIAAHDGVCSWSVLHARIAAGKVSDAERRVIAFNRKHGVVAGYTISFRETSIRARGGIGLAARAGLTQADVEEIWARHGAEIVILNKVAHLKITSLPYPATQDGLTPRQREVLAWVAEGKTTQDIATLMSLSPATVEKHLRLAREALDVESTAHAVARASLMNRLFTFDN